MDKQDFALAIANVRCEGDTDVFPELNYDGVTFEQVCLLDEDVLTMKTSEVREKYSPRITHGTVFKNYGALRAVTQVDPLFNVYYLMLAICVARLTEQNRIADTKQAVHSYRFLPDLQSGRLFAPEYNYRSYVERIERALGDRRVHSMLSIDIKDFYRSVSIYKLADILRENEVPEQIVVKIARTLRIVNDDTLPVGGNASRILAELVLDKLDRAIESFGVKFTRFVDDYTLFLSAGDNHEDILARIRTFLADIGLELNESKIRYALRRNFDISYLEWRMADYETGQNDESNPEWPENELRSFQRSLTDLICDSRFSLAFLGRIPDNPALVNSIAVQLSYLLRWSPKKIPAICRWIVRRSHLLTDFSRTHIADVARCLVADNSNVLKASVNGLHIASLVQLGSQE